MFKSLLWHRVDSWCWFLGDEGKSHSLNILKDTHSACFSRGRMGHFLSHLHSSISGALQRLHGSHTTHSSPASLGTFRLRAQQQRLSTSFILLVTFLSLEQMQHRAGTVEIGIERCWDGNITVIILSYFMCHCAAFSIFCLTSRISIFALSAAGRGQSH